MSYHHHHHHSSSSSSSSMINCDNVISNNVFGIPKYPNDKAVANYYATTHIHILVA